MAIIRLETESLSGAIQRAVNLRKKLDSISIEDLETDHKLSGQFVHTSRQLMIDVDTKKAQEPLGMKREVVVFERFRIPLPPKRQRLSMD